MEINFSKYQRPFSEQDFSLLEDNNLIKKVVFQKRHNKIAIIIGLSSYEHQVAIYFSTKKVVDKFIINLFDKNYHLVLFRLLTKYDFGNSKFSQINTFNKIQELIFFYYVDKKNCKYLYREKTKNSPFWASTILLDSLKKAFTICEIDEDQLIKSIENNISRLASMDVVSAARINFIYLQHNKRNNQYKIGFSVNPKFREKTLQSEEPDIQLFRQWIAPQRFEKLLKAKFKSKRKRGEWFELTQSDLSKIDSIMSKFYPSIGSAITGLSINFIDSMEDVFLD